MHASGGSMCVPVSLLAAVLLAFVAPAGALELRVAAWNLEHLDDANGAGCVGRVDGDYRALGERIHALGADVVAFQEVENATAAARVFDAERWSVEVSSRPSTGYGRSCGSRSRHLEEGAAERGLFPGVGDGDGHWRLELDTDLDIAARAYARDPEDYVSRIDATLAGTYGMGMHRYAVAFFNPGGNVVKRSVLRLVNPGDTGAEVTISAVDDDGDAAPEGDVTLTVPAGEALHLSAQALESGGDGFEGSFGDGVGKWRLIVSADRELHVLSLLRGRRGYLASISQ